MSAETEPRHIREWLGRLRETIQERAARQRAAASEIAAAEAAMRRENAERLTAGAAEHLRACGVDARTAEAFRRGSLRKTKAAEAAHRWIAQSERPVLVLRGGVGAGKSVAAARTLLEAKRRVRTMAHPLADEPVDLLEYSARLGCWTTAAALRFASRYSDGKALSLIDRAYTARWLVLDELRAEDGEGVGQSRLEELLGARYAQGLRTTITTNLDQEQLRALLGERLASRFAEGAVVVDAGDSDLRRGER